MIVCLLGEVRAPHEFEEDLEKKNYDLEKFIVNVQVQANANANEYYERIMVIQFNELFFLLFF